jgi:hypothetical protein
MLYRTEDGLITSVFKIRPLLPVTYYMRDILVQKTTQQEFEVQFEAKSRRGDFEVFEVQGNCFFIGNSTWDRMGRG